MIGLVPAGLVVDLEDDADPFAPVMVHVTCCRQHLRVVRAWVRTRQLPEDRPLTVGTEYLLRHWGQMVESVGVPVWGSASAV